MMHPPYWSTCQIVLVEIFILSRTKESCTLLKCTEISFFSSVVFGGEARKWMRIACVLCQATEKGNQAKNQRKSERLKADFPKKRLLRQDSQSKYSQSQASHGHSLRITEAKPFFLRSTSRHEQAVRQFRDQMAIEYQAEVMAREFKAKKYCPSKPPRSMSAPAGKRVTIAEAPRLLSEQRANHWALNIKPVQDHKDIMQKKWNQEKKRSEEV